MKCAFSSGLQLQAFTNMSKEHISFILGLDRGENGSSRLVRNCAQNPWGPEHHSLKKKKLHSPPKFIEKSVFLPYITLSFFVSRTRTHARTKSWGKSTKMNIKNPPIFRPWTIKASRNLLQETSSDYLCPLLSGTQIDKPLTLIKQVWDRTSNVSLAGQHKAHKTCSEKSTPLLWVSINAKCYCAHKSTDEPLNLIKLALDRTYNI